MNAKPVVRVIRHKERKVTGIQAQVESAASPNRWSAAVKSWVIEFRQSDRTNPLPAFDSLFKDALPSRHA